MIEAWVSLTDVKSQPGLDVAFATCCCSVAADPASTLVGSPWAMSVWNSAQALLVRWPISPSITLTG